VEIRRFGASILADSYMLDSGIGLALVAAVKGLRLLMLLIPAK
jgi:hypothetical protein